MMDIRAAYQASIKSTKFGIEGYHVQNKYFDPRKQTFKKQKSSKKIQTKRGSYLDDYVKLKEKVPGPGVYDYSLRGSEYSKIKSKHSHISDKKTFIDQIIAWEAKEKHPAPGQYQLNKKRPSSASTKKRNTPDRATYLDYVQYEATINPGVGCYNPRPQSAKVERKDRMKPEDWIKKHNTKRKSASTARQPESCTYNPVIIGKKDFSKRTKNVTTWGNIERFKQDKNAINIGPGKYQGHIQWGTKVSQGSKSRAHSVYYQ